MGTRQTIALLKSHVRRDDQEFLPIAMEMAAHEARQGHSQVAERLKKLIDEARKHPANWSAKSVLVVPDRSELSSVLLTAESETRLSDMVLPELLGSRLKRILLQQRRQQTRLGSGKTMTAAALAGELHLPLQPYCLKALSRSLWGKPQPGSPQRTITEIRR